ncbi:glycosyltransferase [uncultured Algoriphagus sp.]|uniref:glycosyltransferase n=1 Tax=uncultured Algoriphagus sp. TaxID=417365 RepID=UPI002596D1CE|nr:glycosyltransferase [uncultured Algoriphagus sp.]
MSKKKILFYSDQPDWAYDHIAKGVASHLKLEYDFYFDYCCCHLFKINRGGFFNIIREDLHRTYKNILCLFKVKSYWDWNYSFLKYKLTPFWKSNFFFSGKEYSRRVLPPWKKYDIIFYFDFYFDRYAKLSKKGNMLIKGIYTESFPPECIDLDYLTLLKKESINFKITKSDFFNKYFEGICVFACGSQNIKSNFESFKIKKFFLNYMIYEERFIPRPKQNSEKLVIGWSGNPNREFKNFFSIIKPTVESLQREGLNLELKTRFSGPIETLHEFYSDVDLVMIASSADAGPSLFREASLSGIPSISTRVGFPNMVIKNEVNGFFAECEIESFINKLREIYFNRGKLNMAKERIRRDYLEIMGNDVLIKNWREAFNSRCAE